MACGARRLSHSPLDQKMKPASTSIDVISRILNLKRYRQGVATSHIPPARENVSRHLMAISRDSGKWENRHRMVPGPGIARWYAGATYAVPSLSAARYRITSVFFFLSNGMEYGVVRTSYGVSITGPCCYCATLAAVNKRACLTFLQRQAPGGKGVRRYNTYVRI